MYNCSVRAYLGPKNTDTKKQMKYDVVPTLKYYPSTNIPFDVYKFLWNSIACKLRQNNVSQAVFIAFKN